MSAKNVFCAMLLGLATLAVALCSAQVSAEEVKGRVEWPREWVVFAPFDRHDPVPEPEEVRSVPETMSAPATDLLPDRTEEPRRMEVEPGVAVELSDLFETRWEGNVAYVFLEINSPEDQTATLGMGADWWLQAWVNGEPVFDTLETGNDAYPVTILNHQVDVPLAEGANVLAVRLISGRASATLAVGGPNEFAAAEAREAARLAARELNILPERFEDRMLFPADEQALVMARRGLALPETDADLSRGELAGLRPMPERQMYFRPIAATRGEVLDTLSRRFDDPVKIRLSKQRYPWEDRHLDAIVYATPAEEGRAPRGRLEVILKDAEGAALARHEISELSPSGLFFSVGFPEALQGAEGSLEVVWRQGDTEVGRAEKGFLVLPRSDAPRAGRVPLRILNEPGATVAGAPMTVGVPFPRGALEDEASVRLVDEGGAEIPLQTRETARWSRYGPVKWLLCDFTVDLDGGPREVYLEYGPDIQRAERADISTGELAAGFPALDAGRVRVGEGGLSFDAAGDGSFRPVLSPQAMLGAFVHHEDGKTYSMPADTEYAFEELGSEKAVVRRTGWYVEEATGQRFCQFVTRFVFHRDSPVVRVFHTWIFTGDGNRDRIADMGWRFDAAQPVSDGGILTAFDGGEWVSGESLVQFDYERFLLPDAGSEHEGRTPGVLSALVGDARVSFGAKDFWQNFPSELEVGEDGFAFFNWPRRNPPPRLERPVAREDAFRSRFVHEGEVLDFRIPDEYADGPIWQESSSREGHIAQGRPESVNAQGIARTEEMFLYFADASLSADDAAKVMQGLNDETLRAVADPAWVAASGAFGDIYHRDAERFPEEERVIELIHTAPGRWVERLGFYGMWVHGDYPTWNMSLQNRTVSAYRTLRKNHHQYPYRWAPFARSGDPRMLKLAENAARQMADANFCHFATAEVDAAVGPDHFRRQGWWDRSLLPWAGRGGPLLRSYTIDSDYLWHAYYMMGYGRARDVALLFGELTQQDYNTTRGPRGSCSFMSSYLDMYQATFDPWFLATVYEIADLYSHLYSPENVEDHVDKHAFGTIYDPAGHGWRGEKQKLYEFTGDDEHRRLALNNAIVWASPQLIGKALVGSNDTWGDAPADLSAFAWTLTGDEFYLGRAVAALDAAKTGVYEGDIEYLRGLRLPSGHGYLPMRNSRWDGPGRAMAAIARAETLPEPVGNPFMVNAEWVDRDDEARYNFRLPEVTVRKDGAEAVPLYLDARGRPDEAYAYRIASLDGGFELSGAWSAPERIEIPADAPEGVYRVAVTGHVPYPEGATDRATFRRRQGRVFFPLGGPETPEVMAFDREDRGASVVAGGQGHWFMVPEGVEEFWIEFGRAIHFNRASVWNPDGERVWDLSYADSTPDRASVPVPAEHAGKLWRATGGPFVIDPQIPPYFAPRRSKWFNPEE